MITTKNKIQTLKEEYEKEIERGLIKMTTQKQKIETLIEELVKRQDEFTKENRDLFARQQTEYVTDLINANRGATLELSYVIERLEELLK